MAGIVDPTLNQVPERCLSWYWHCHAGSAGKTGDPDQSWQSPQTSPATAAADEIRRRELAAFLRSRRERMTPDRSACPVAAAGARRACAARRSPSSPASASPGTRGSSRAATSTRPRRCSTRSRARCCFDAAGARRTCSRSPAPRDTTPRRDCAPAQPRGAAACSTSSSPYPALVRQRPLRHPRLQPRVRRASSPTSTAAARGAATACGCSSPTRSGAGRRRLGRHRRPHGRRSTARRWPSTWPSRPGST